MSLCVDDSTLGFDFFEKGYGYFWKSPKIMSDAGFELRTWRTDSVELKKKIYDENNETVSDVCLEKKVL